jgi:AAA domain
MNLEQFEAMDNDDLDRIAPDVVPLLPERKIISPSVVRPLIVSSADFLAGFVPPDYLIDGLLQRRFCYALTAPTGSGKTAIALLISASVALDRPLGEYQLERGRVLYLAGENPDDVRMRWLAMADSMKFDPAKIDVHFLPGVFKLSEITERIKAEVKQIGDVALVVVDTSAAYFEGDDENGNVQMGIHARRMRSLVTLPGEPCVLVACHPVKNAAPDNMLPRGGGAFVAEIDGNLTCFKSDSVVTMHWQGKYRGPDFAPLPFRLISATTALLKDSKGRLIPTVVAEPLSEKERGEAEAHSRSDEDDLLIAIAENDRASMSGLATALQWLAKDSKPYKARVQRSAERLKKGGFVKIERGGLILTPKGKKEAKRAKYNADAAGSKYG